MLHNRGVLGYLLPMNAHTLPLFNALTPFMLQGEQVRGRIVRLGSVADTVLGRYDYPPHVARLLGEMLLAAAMLSANLKDRGIFTLQIRGNGLVPLVVVDVVYGGQIRGYADVPEASREALLNMATYSPRALVGEGAYLAITLDSGVGAERYQGIVALEGDSIAEALTAYFTNSEQINVAVELAAAHMDGWRAGGIMIERMPDASDKAKTDDSWDYARAVMRTVTAAELLDPLLDAPELLYRLFHEEGVWVYDPQFLSVGCRCSRERITDVLKTIPGSDLQDMVVDGVIDVHCQFCNKSEVFKPADIGLV